MNTAELGLAIRRERERRHMTQHELGESLGVHSRTVGNWERGDNVPRNRLGAIEEFLAAGPPARVKSPAPRWFLADDGEEEPTLWRHDPEFDYYPEAVLRRCDLPERARVLLWPTIVEAVTK